MKSLLVLSLVLMSLLPVNAKRAAPKRAKPVVAEGIRYEATWRAFEADHKAGCLRAVSESTGEELWLLEIYRPEYKEDLETDVQDVFITDLRLVEPGLLEVTNERGNTYMVDLKSKEVQAR